MRTYTFQLSEAQSLFIQKFKDLDFESENDVLNYALKLLENEIQKNQDLEKSAILYAEIYAEDADLKSLTESALMIYPKMYSRPIVGK